VAIADGLAASAAFSDVNVGRIKARSAGSDGGVAAAVEKVERGS
jgi:hypothetical protein